MCSKSFRTIQVFTLFTHDPCSNKTQVKNLSSKLTCTEDKNFERKIFQIFTIVSTVQFALLHSTDICAFVCWPKRHTMRCYCCYSEARKILLHHYEVVLRAHCAPYVCLKDRGAGEGSSPYIHRCMCVWDGKNSQPSDIILSEMKPISSEK